jgi:sugar phosphate isomerase/epimerase
MWELERTFGVIKEAGFDGIELMVTRDPRTQTPQVPARLAAREGLAIDAVHAPMLVITRRVWGPDFLNIIEKSTALAGAVGADVVIVHPPYLWELRYQAWLMGRLDGFTAAHGVAVAVENMFRLWVGGRPIRGHRWISPKDLQRFTQITLDTSHCGVDGFDILQALDLLAGKIAHVHLSDSQGEHRDNHSIPGTGVLPLEQFVTRLPEVGYRGAVSLELDMRAFAEDQKGAVAALREAREFCLQRLPPA